MFPGMNKLIDLFFISIFNFFLVGIYYCFKELTDANIFIIIYGMTSIYFAVRLLKKENFVYK